MPFTRQQPFSKKTTDLPDVPSPAYTPTQIKEYIETPSDENKAFMDSHITELEANTGAGNIGAKKADGTTSTVQGAIDEKETKTTVSGINTRLTTAEGNITSLGQNKADKGTDWTGTWQGFNPSQVDQTIRDQVNTNTSQLADIVHDMNADNVDNTGTNDITNVLNIAILNLCKKTSGHKKITFNGIYKITGTVLLPSDVVLDLNGSTIIGNGYNTNTIFKSGIFDGNAIREYDDTTYNTSIERAGVINGIIKDCGKAFDIVMMNRLSKFEHLYFINCEQSINATRCFYAKFKFLSYHSTDWSTKDDSSNPAFNFQTENNAMEISHIYVNSRRLGMQVYDITSGLEIDTCAFENCDVGFKELGNDIRNLKLSNCYVENCASGMQLTTCVEVDNCFFNGCTTGIESSLSAKINNNNFFLNCTTKIKTTSQDNGGIDFIEYPLLLTFNNAPSLDVGTDVAPSTYGQIKQRNIQASGTNFVITDSLKGQPNIFQFAGKQGDIPSTVPFCNITQSFLAGSTTDYNIIIDTSLTWEQFAFYGFHFTNQDNQSVWELYGMIYGQIIKQDDVTGKTITVANNNGMLQITIGTFTHPTGFYAVNGAIRHL